MAEGAAGMIRDNIWKFTQPDFHSTRLLYGVTVMLVYPPSTAVMTISSLSPT